MRQDLRLNPSSYLQQFIDGLLRIGLVLRDQIERHTDAIDESLLHQRDGDQKLSERWVINEAARSGVISHEMKNELWELYDARNKCIHRYIISDINYDSATQLVCRYADAMDETRDSIGELEDEQSRLTLPTRTMNPTCGGGFREWPWVRKLDQIETDNKGVDGTCDALG